MSGASDIHRLNSLSVWHDFHLDRFICRNSADFIQSGRHSVSGNLNQLLIRRAMAIRNIRTETWRTKDNRNLWAALGADRMLRFRGSMPSLTSAATRSLTHDKNRTKGSLQAHGIPVPAGRTLDATDILGAREWFRTSGAEKVVLKPAKGTSGGHGVVAAIRTEDELAQAMSTAIAARVLLERHIDGADHRLLVIGGKYTAGTLRHPASVTGDGVSTIRGLVEAKNEQRDRNPYCRKAMLALREDVLKRLNEMGLTPDSVPDKGLKVQLTSIANVGAGADSETLTSVHPDFVAIAEQCWHAFADMAFCGVDLIAEDITKPAADQTHAVLEINANADIALHHFPVYGDALDAAGALVDYLFPDEPLVEPVAVEVVVQGKVHQVGLRLLLKRMATQYGVTGYCVNQQDGKVLAVFEGSPFSVESMLKKCAIGSPRSIVRSMQYKSVPFVGHEDFEIRRP